MARFLKVAGRVCYHEDMKKTISNPTSRLFSNPKYQGKHIVAIANKVFTADTGEAANELLTKAIKKHPRSTPTITYIPKDQMLVLCQK